MSDIQVFENPDLAEVRIGTMPISDDDKKEDNDG